MSVIIKKKEIFYAHTIATLGAGLSLALTMQFAIDIGGDQHPWLSATFGLFLELLKLFCAVIGLKLLHSKTTSHKISGFGVFALSLLLICISIAASVSHLARKDALQARHALLGSQTYVGLTEKKETLLGALKSLSARSAIDAQSKYTVVRRESGNLLIEVQRLQRELDMITAQLSKLEHEATGTDNFVTSIASIFAPVVQTEKKMSAPDDEKSLAKKLRIAMHFALAAFLELGVVVALHVINIAQSSNSRSQNQTFCDPTERPDVTLATGSQKRRFKKQQGYGSQNEILRAPEAEPDRKEESLVVLNSDREIADRKSDDTDMMIAKDTALCDRYAYENITEVCDRMRQVLLCDEIEPAYRPMRSALGIRQQTVTQCFRVLLNEGFLEKSGKRYEVAQKVRHTDSHQVTA